MDYMKFFRWENHFETAPLTFLLARISTDLTDSTAEWAMRLPALIAGILCIPAAFWLGRVMRGDALGLLAAALVTFDPSQVDQSQQARMYSVLMLLLLSAIALTIKLVREPAPLWRWAVAGFFYGLLLWTTQFTVAVWVGIALGIGGLLALGWATGRPHPKARQVIFGTIAAFVVASIVAVVGIVHIFRRMTSGEVGDRPDLSYGAMAREIIVAAKDLIDLTPAGLAVYAVAAVGLVLLARHCKTSVAILGGIALMNVVILFRFLRIHHFMDPRYLFCILPAVYIGLGMFAVGFASRTLRLAAGAVIVAYIGVQAWQSTHLESYYQQPDRYLFAREIARVRDQMAPGETASIYPGVGVILGQYYRLPQDPALFEALYGDDHLPREEQRVPQGFKAPATWVILAMYNFDDGKQRQRRLDTLNLIAAHYGTRVDEREFDKHVRQRRVATAKVSSDGVKMESIGVE
jgi:4-amino-4-deoxy-L-arabinose transferase-like glycosyltransferase